MLWPAITRLAMSPSTLTVASKKFICGDPMNPATNKLKSILRWWSTRSAATAAPPLSQKSMRQLGLRRQRKPAQEVRKRNFFKHSSMAPVRPYSGKKCQNSTCRNPKQALLQVRERHIQKCPFRTPVILIRIILMGFILSQVNLSSASRLP